LLVHAVPGHMTALGRQDCERDLPVMLGHQRCHDVDAGEHAENGKGYHDDEDYPKRSAPVSDAEAGGDGDENRDGGLGVLWVVRRSRCWQVPL
jgi:hypothetical protein